ncbi:hypothetical protein BD769DRAFT_1381100 [Suillus cothurnatus]|nr:hypothetical protein BD769DRAFT_1381100 [Suillus cothurnatus]
MLGAFRNITYDEEIGLTTFAQNLIAGTIDSKICFNVFWSVGHMTKGSLSALLIRAGNLGRDVAAVHSIADVFILNIRASSPPISILLERENALKWPMLRAIQINCSISQAPVGPLSSANVSFYGYTFASWQDTWYTGPGAYSYVVDSIVYGQIDFADIVARSFRIWYGAGMHGQAQKALGMRHTLPIRKSFGPVLFLMRISHPVTSGRCYLGHPWNTLAIAAYLRAYMDESIHPAGFTPWSREYFAEYNSYGPGGDMLKRVPQESTRTHAQRHPSLAMCRACSDLVLTSSHSEARLLRIFKTVAKPIAIIIYGCYTAYFLRAGQIPHFLVALISPSGYFGSSISYQTPNSIQNYYASKRVPLPNGVELVAPQISPSLPIGPRRSF